MKLNTIYKEDCLKTLKKMEDSSIDLVITSPPYNMNLRISKGRYHSRQIVKEIVDSDDFYSTEKIYQGYLIAKELVVTSVGEIDETL